ncbi:MAG: hypothetical protein D6738_07105 [Acidobacteria bacterium]|nr:MAG: hypothetical protein D6738_07105 [Acidobacteriota bacterium]
MRPASARPRRRPAVPLLLLLLAVAVPASAAPDDTFAPWRSLALDGPGVDAAGRRLAIGHLAVDLSEGTLWPVRAGNGELAGMLFEGAGRFVYRSDDPQDLVSFEANLRRQKSHLTLQHNAVSDELSSLLVLFARPAFDDVVEALATADGPPPSASANAALADYLDRLRLAQFEFDHLAPFARANGEPYQYVYVEIDGRRERTGYAWDLERSFRESLFHYTKYPGVEFRFRDVLSTQPIPGYERGGPLTVSLSRLDLDVRSEDNRNVAIDATLEFQVERSGSRMLILYLLNTKDPKTASWESDRRALHVRSLTTADGTPVSFSHRYHELAVDLGRACEDGETLVLKARYDGDFFTDAGGDFNENYRELGFESWYPTPGSLAAAGFAFHARVKTKAPFFPIVTGDTIRREEKDGYHVVEAGTDHPVWAPVIIAGKYKVDEFKAGDRLVRVYTTPVISSKDRKALAGLVAMMWDLYGRMIGPLPWKELELVERRSLLQFGISPAGVIYLSTPNVDTSDPVTRKFQAVGANGLVAHEVAHQWFGHIAWPHTMQDTWLNESNAEYLAGLGMGLAVAQMEKQGKKVKKSLDDFATIKRRWQSGAHTVAGHGTILGAEQLEGGGVAGAYRFDLLYSRGPAILHMFRTLIGDERFMAIWKRYLDREHPGARDTQDFIDACNAVMKSDWSWFWNQWLGKPWIPEIRVEHTVSGNRLHVVADQDPATFMKIHLPLVLTYPGGRRGVKILFQERPHQEFTVTLPAAPQRVDIDPARNNLATYK